MDDHTEPENQPPASAQGTPAREPEIDLEALTSAVERLLRRDLRLERERAGGEERPKDRFR
ncbi:MAG TPA: hypothetical protein VD886_19450 [Herpetosiphonaceae bacterium]|nr:hypothetical protein [Herpetosiphonaceae bacterium]